MISKGMERVYIDTQQEIFILGDGSMSNFISRAVIYSVEMRSLKAF